ncbi:MAG: phytanoyl-CoA dioxygenase family protein [Methylovulum sp.]|nr:phytanoyl-CoA dioxygenase family protein [Methylovulum sp.]
MQQNNTYHSKFGGLWIDHTDWKHSLEKKMLSNEDKALVEKFISDGYIVIEGGASNSAIDAFQRKIEAGFLEGNPDLLYQIHGQQQANPLAVPVDRLGTRVVDSFVPLTEALELFSSPSLIHFLQIIFESSPLLFQSLSFDQGSQQGLHQDTAYVVVDSPLQLAACWIALEDVIEGAGELEYAPGSHRLPDWNFGGDRKHWIPSEDGADIHTEWSKFLVQEAKNMGGTKKFLAKKGDILIWHADLAHGGTPVTRPELTRQSLVGHFCPITTTPYYFKYNPNRAIMKKYKSLYYSSQHYDL